METTLLVLSLIICAISIVEATRCKPYSSFKIDCNSCRCSWSGEEYSCTNHLCTPQNPDLFDEGSHKDGYVLLKPKTPPKFNDDDFVLSKRSRRRRNVLLYNEELKGNSIQHEDEGNVYLNSEVDDSDEASNDENDQWDESAASSEFLKKLL